MKTTTQPRSSSLRVCALAFAAFNALAACDDGSTNSTSGLPKDKPLSSLTAAERASYCAASEKTFGDAFNSPEVTCGLSGLLAAGFAAAAGAATDKDLQTACQMSVDECRKDPPKPEPRMSSGMCSIPANCNATVGDSDACLAEVLAALGSLGKCDMLKLSDIKPPGTSTPESELGPACKALEAKCPGAALRPPT